MCKILRGIEAEIKTKTQKNLERREFEQGEAQKGSNANVGSPRYQDPATRGSGFSENVRFPKKCCFRSLAFTTGNKHRKVFER